MSLFAELQRRNVIRVAIFYVVTAWLVLQVADILLPAFDVPETAIRILVFVLAMGFIPTLIFSPTAPTAFDRAAFRRPPPSWTSTMVASGSGSAR